MLCSNVEIRLVLNRTGWYVDSNGDVWTNWVKPRYNSPKKLWTWSEQLSLVPIGRTGTRPQVYVDRLCYQVGILVLETFVGACPNGLYCCHKDYDPWNNRLTNLYWGTPSENTKDSIRNGRMNYIARNTAKGENSGRALLAMYQAREIRQKFASGDHTYYTLADEYDVCWKVIRGVVLNKTYKET